MKFICHGYVIILFIIFMFDIIDCKMKNCTVLPTINVMVCKNMDSFDETDLLVQNYGKGFNLVIDDVTNDIKLIINDSNRKMSDQYIYFNTIKFYNVCLKYIQPSYFSIINGLNKPVQNIEMTNVSCMSTLQIADWDMLNEHLETLILITPDLLNIQKGFFNRFTNLNKLYIRKSKLMEIDSEILTKLKSLKELDLSNNQIEYLDSNFEIKKDFKYGNNPFKCDCKLMGFINKNKYYFDPSYRCASPVKYKGTELSDLPDLCVEPTKAPIENSAKVIEPKQEPNVKQQKDKKEEIQTGGIKLEIVIPTAVIVIAILITLITLVVIKRRRDLKEKKKNFHEGYSPSVPNIENRSPLMKNPHV